MTAVVCPPTTEVMTITRGDGAYIYDDSGKQYLDAMAGLWCTSLGYGNEEVVEVAAKQMRELSFNHMFGGKTHSVAIELADKLADMVPMDNARVFLGNSGSDANDTLLKLIRYHAEAIGRPERTKVIVQERGYHGVTVAMTSLTNFAPGHAQLPFDTVGALHIGSPHYYRCAEAGESEYEFVTRRVMELDALIQAENPDTIAAMLAEPVNCAGGVIIPPAGYFEAIQSVLNKYGIMFWDDEVTCGFGRLGTAFGADKFDIQPKMMACAKALSSAYVPLSAAIVGGDITDAVVGLATKSGAFPHGYTYSGHPLGCAVASKVIDIYMRDRLFDHAAVVGSYLEEKLNAFLEHPLVGEVSAMGMIGALELVADKRSKKAFDSMNVGQFCARAAEEHGLIVRPLDDNRVAICPPLIIQNEHVDEIVEKLDKALTDTLNYTTREGLI